MLAYVGVSSNDDGRGYAVASVVDYAGQREASIYQAQSSFEVSEFLELLREPIGGVAVQPGWERCIVASAERAGLRVVVRSAIYCGTPTDRARSLAVELLELSQGGA